MIQTAGWTPEEMVRNYAAGLSLHWPESDEGQQRLARFIQECRLYDDARSNKETANTIFVTLPITRIAARVVFARFPNFHSNPDELRQLKAELYKVLLPVAQGKQMVEIAERLLKVATR